MEFATLEWVHWFNERRRLEPIGNIPPAEAETVLGLIASWIEDYNETTRIQGSECARPASSSQLEP